MAKGYHEVTVKNPFAGGRKPSVWPQSIGGRDQMASMGVPQIIKESAHKLVRLYAQFVVGQLTQNELIEKIEDIASQQEIFMD